MNEDDVELVTRLCTRAGMIMEDVSTLAISLPSRNAGVLATTLDQLARAASDITILIAAAKAVAGSG